jgi:hypothetical protein
LLFSVIVSLLYSTAPELNPLLVQKTAEYINSICMQNLTILEDIAKSSEARAGNWQGIKKQIQDAPDRIPGVWFYVLEDGNYYSLQRDFTNLNLKNREYFEPLFAGQTIKGHPVYSRSTGKKSAVMAVPIMVEGKVKGAMGLSIYLDDFHHQISEKSQPGEDFTWFVLDSKGLTMLDMDADFIFMNTFEDAPESMQYSIREALKKDRGPIEYDLGEVQRKGFFHKIPDMDWWLIMARKSAHENTQTRLEISLGSLVPELQKSMEEIAQNALTATEAKIDWAIETSTRDVMQALIRENPLVVDVAFIDTKGIMRHIEPPEFQNAEGTDVMEQDHIQKLFQKQEPLLSEAFFCEEGFLAASMIFPVKNTKNELQGAISLLLRPELIIGQIVKKTAVPESVELVVMEPAGRLLFDDDAKEIGRLLFEDPLYSEYESLLKLGRAMQQNRSGKGDYIFESRGGEQKTLKTASWDSIEIFGTQWRVLVAKANP